MGPCDKPKEFSFQSIGSSRGAASVFRLAFDKVSTNMVFVDIPERASPEALARHCGRRLLSSIRLADAGCAS